MASILSPAAPQNQPWVPCLVSPAAVADLIARGQAVQMQVTLAPAATPRPSDHTGYSEPRTLAQWAAAFDVSTRTLTRWFADRQVNAKRIGKLWAVHVDDIPSQS